MRPRRRSALLLAVLVLVAVAVPASASHRFTDVGSTSVHHGSIAAVADAGITVGCDSAGTRFCPDQAVSRAQMSTFLLRGAGHATADHSTTTLTAGTGNVNGVAVTVSVDGPGQGGGQQQVVLQGSATVYHDGTAADCPCEVQAFLFRARDGRQGPSSWAVLPGEPAGSGSISASVPVTWAVPIASGQRDEYHLAVFVDGTTAPGFRADGSLTAVTAPFGTVPRD
jgi:hypothetical protein